ncbi:MAG TPA: FAD:protein FMN transferase [Ktedonobacterales bacterium]|nr:FAD:protein FMN transferase [Ktedonobacterales bacterium]
MTPTYTDLPGLTCIKFVAMGTTVTALLSERHAHDGAEGVQALFAEWEDVLSRFKPESELSRLNARAGAPVSVSPLLYTVLETALQAADATQGIYDPTLLTQIVAIGYDVSFETLPADVAAMLHTATPLPGGGWRDITLDPVRHTVTLPRGIGLDFGGIAKGMAVDAVLGWLRQVGCEHALVNAGGDLATLGLPPSVDAWPVAVPLRDGWQTVPLARGAVATSGVARRHWRQGGVTRHHLLDPRTGQPATGGLWSVSAAAETCAQAEVAAKAAFILGPEAGARFLSRHHLAGLLVREDGGRTGVGDWPAYPEMTATV